MRSKKIEALDKINEIFMLLKAKKLFGISSLNVLRGSQQSNKLTKARLYCYRVLKKEGYSLRQIGNVMCKDSSTVSSSLAKWGLE